MTAVGKKQDLKKEFAAMEADIIRCPRCNYHLFFLSEGEHDSKCPICKSRVKSEVRRFFDVEECRDKYEVCTWIMGR